MPRVLVLGGTGFLGRSVAAALGAAGMSVRAAARGEVPGQHRGLRIDLCTSTPASLRALLHELRPDAVVNCAGATDGHPRTLDALNVTVPGLLVDALLGAERPCRLVHLGSAAEYGATPFGSSVGEEDPVCPVGAYGESKLAGTLRVGLGRRAGLDAVVLRVFNPVGPGAPETTLLGRLAAALRAAPPGTQLETGPLSATRDVLDVRDVADAVVAAVSADELPHGIVNVGSGEATAVRDLVDLLVRHAGGGRGVVEGEGGSVRSAAVAWQRADVSRALADLDWKPVRPLARAVADCLGVLP